MQFYLELYQIHHSCVCMINEIGSRKKYLMSYLKKNMGTMIGHFPMDTKCKVNYYLHPASLYTSFFYNLEFEKFYYYHKASSEIRCLNVKLGKKTPKTLLNNIDIPFNGLTYDWVSNKIYYIDSAEESINSITLYDLEKETIKLSPKGSTIVALAIQPRKRILFYVCRDANYKTIFKCSLNGENVSLVYKMSLGFANTILVNSIERVILCINVKKRFIEKINFNGERLGLYPINTLYTLIAKLNKNYLSTGWEDDSLIAVELDRGINLFNSPFLSRIFNRNNYGSVVPFDESRLDDHECAEIDDNNRYSSSVTIQPIED